MSWLTRVACADMLAIQETEEGQGMRADAHMQTNPYSREA
jgi:hypothetical protein